MTRLPHVDDMITITAITHAREQAALARISQAAVCRERAAQAVLDLLAINPQPKTATEAELISKWLLWRQQELKKRNVALAAAEAEYQRVVQQAGRQIAEHAAMSECLVQAKTDALKNRETRNDRHIS